MWAWRQGAKVTNRERFYQQLAHAKGVEEMGVPVAEVLERAVSLNVLCESGASS